MTTTLDNRLNGVHGTVPTNESLAASGTGAPVTIGRAQGKAGAGRARYDNARTLFGLPSIRIDTSWERAGTPYLDIPIPESGQWWARWYVWVPRLQDAGFGINEVRWIAEFPDVSLGYVVHATAAGNAGTRLQSTDLAAPAITWDDESGNAVTIGQWWRVELSSVDTSIQTRIYPGHAMTPVRIHTWDSAAIGRRLRLSAYRYRRGVLLQPGDNDAARGDTAVSDLQRNLMTLGYPLPQYGADGWYGQEATDAVYAFQQDRQFTVVDGVAGPETLAAIDLALRMHRSEGYPPSVYVSHVAVSDSGALGPATEPVDLVVPVSGTVRVAGSGTFHAVQGPTVAPTGTVRVSGSAETSREARPTITGTVKVSGAAGVTREARPAITGTVRVAGEVFATRHAHARAEGTVRVAGEVSATKHVVRALSATVRVSGSVVIAGGGRSAVALDYARGHISDPFEPTEDDQDVANIVTVTREGGSEYTAETTTGPLSSQDPPFGIGAYPESVTVNVADDFQLRDQAGWRALLGTWDAARYPTVTVDLAENPDLIQAVASRESGDALQVLNPPDWLPPETIELAIEGYTETLNTQTWRVEFNASPGGPWLIGVTEDPDELPSPSDTSRADTTGALVDSAVTETATTLAVRTIAGPVWVDSANYPECFPFDIRAGGEVMRVTAIAGTGDVQTFTVARALNGIRKAHASGTAVSLAYPAYVGL